MSNRSIASVMLAVPTVILTLAFATGCSDADPNKECANHGGVQEVKQSGNNVNGGVCKDGHYFDGGDV